MTSYSFKLYEYLCFALVFLGACSCAHSAAIDPVFDLPHRGCYFTNWAQYRQGIANFTTANVDPTLCTYILVAFANVSDSQLIPLEWNDAETFQNLVALKATNPTLKILLSIGGWTLSHQVVEMATTAQNRSAFISSAVTNLRQWGLDGLDVDWEFPTANTMELYSTLLTELRAAFDAESAQTGKTRLALTAAVHLISDGGFDGVVINKTLDIANVMTYDLTGGWDWSKVGHQAALFLGPFGIPQDCRWYCSPSVANIMKAWEDAGVAKSKLVVGLPLYGRGWMLANPNDHGLSAMANGPVTASKYTTEVGAWPFYEICERIQSDKATKVFNTSIQASYAYTDTWWMGYDDLQTIITKSNWVKENGYGGVFVWDLAQDDFRNICGFGKNPLLNAIRQTLTQTGSYNAMPTSSVSISISTEPSTAPQSSTTETSTSSLELSTASEAPSGATQELSTTSTEPDAAFPADINV